MRAKNINNNITMVVLLREAFAIIQCILKETLRCHFVSSWLIIYKPDLRHILEEFGNVQKLATINQFFQNIVE